MHGNPFWEPGRSTDRTLNERRRREVTTLLASCLEMRADDGRFTSRDRLGEMHFECFAGRPFGRASIATSHRDPSGRRVAIVKCRDDGLSVEVRTISSRRERLLTTPESPISGVTNAPIFPTSLSSGDTNDTSRIDFTIQSLQIRPATTGSSRVGSDEDSTTQSTSRGVSRCQRKQRE